jgi:hypothetical protein
MSGTDSAFDEFIDSPHMFDSLENQPSFSNINLHNINGLADAASKSASTSILSMAISGTSHIPRDSPGYLSHIPPTFELNNLEHDTDMIYKESRDALGFITQGGQGLSFKNSFPHFSQNLAVPETVISSTITVPFKPQNTNSALSPNFQTLSMNMNMNDPSNASPIPISSPILVSMKRTTPNTPSNMTMTMINPIATSNLDNGQQPISSHTLDIPTSHSLPHGQIIFEGGTYSDFYSSSFHRTQSTEPHSYIQQSHTGYSGAHLTLGSHNVPPPVPKHKNVNIAPTPVDLLLDPTTSPMLSHSQNSHIGTQRQIMRYPSIVSPIPLSSSFNTTHSTSPSPSLSMSPDPGHLSMTKKERNRLAAERCRKKKQELIGSLSTENQQLQQEILELKKVNQVLEQKLDYLISVMATYGIPMPYSKS